MYGIPVYKYFGPHFTQPSPLFSSWFGFRPLFNYNHGHGSVTEPKYEPS